jgi:NADH-quinone oxidoreductase subunit C
MIDLLNQLTEKLRENFNDGLLSAELHYDFPVFIVEKKIIIEVLSFLKNDPDMGFNFLTTLCGLHMPDNKGSELGVMYQLQNMVKNQRIRIKIFMPDGDNKVPSATDLWPTANWMERQEYDFFGFDFTGHPDLKRILNMDEMNYFPMRKEYPLEDGSRDDKNDKMFGR